MITANEFIKFVEFKNINANQLNMIKTKLDFADPMNTTPLEMIAEVAFESLGKQVIEIK